ncbi:hypothetical protein [Occallatibacter savannae]|uniref:hypothetical protein n=1 Tax=Occallatibacter savannae TaxID=1002691 RepID=UPI000D690FB5|nr:hypothetical protein [Occallatibacter savannae]
MKKISIALLFAVCGLGYGQSALRIGMSRQEVLSKLGSPLKYFDSGTQLYLRHPPIVAQGNVFEVYSRRLLGSSFQLKVHYADDLSQSRLYPTRRLDWLVVEFDRPQPLRQVLRTCPEIVMLCRQGCTLRHGSESKDVKIADVAKTISISANYWDEQGEMQDVKNMEDPVSRVNMEKYFESPLSEEDLGGWTTPSPKR